MELNQAEIDKLQKMLQEGKTLDDLMDLINCLIEIQNEKQGTNYKLITSRRLKHYYWNINEKYVKFNIPKKTGGIRTVTAPDRYLKKIQRRINLLLNLFYWPNYSAHGFIESRNIVTNAKMHVGKKFILNVDLKDFFPSIHFGRVKAVLQIKMFRAVDSRNYFYDLGESLDYSIFLAKRQKLYEDLIVHYNQVEANRILEDLGYGELNTPDQWQFIEINYINGKAHLVQHSNNLQQSTINYYLRAVEKKDANFFSQLSVLKNLEEISVKIEDIEKPFGLKPEFAHIIANFCCHNGTLPQGAPTSPLLTNIICQRLDSKMVKISKANKCFYTRYADDLTFSNNSNIFNNEFLNIINDVIQSEGFMINEKKTRVQKKAVRQEVTGIIVNEKLNLPRSYIRKVRAALHNWEKQGYESANAKFASLYPDEKGFLRNKTIPPMESVLNGKILFLGMVRGKKDSMYLKYKNKFEELLKSK